MESEPGRPTAAEAADALSEAEASRTTLAHAITTPTWCFTSLGAAVAAQIGLTALGFGEGALWPVAAGLAVFAAVAAVQLARFRRRNGVWLGGFASRVVLGTGTPASVAYAIALAAAIWAASDAHWWLVALWSAAGGAGYALGGHRWLRTYRAEPAAHGRGESAAWLVLIAVAAAGGAALLLAGA